MQTEKEQALDFNTLFGCLFTVGNAIEYLTVMAVHLKEHKANYVANKCNEAVSACNKAYEPLMRALMANLSPAEKELITEALERNKELVYKLFLLDETDQKRVSNLIDKINRE